MQSMEETNFISFSKLVKKKKEKNNTTVCFRTSVCMLLLFFCVLCVLEVSSHIREAEEIREREKVNTHIRPPPSSSSLSL